MGVPLVNHPFDSILAMARRIAPGESIAVPDMESRWLNANQSDRGSGRGTFDALEDRLIEMNPPVTLSGPSDGDRWRLIRLAASPRPVNPWNRGEEAQ